jgi:hypothetical protein
VSGESPAERRDRADRITHWLSYAAIFDALGAVAWWGWGVVPVVVAMLLIGVLWGATVQWRDHG